MEGNGSPIKALSHMPRPERWLSWPSALLTAVSLLVPLEMASQARLDHGGSREAGDAAPHLRFSVDYLAGACSPRGRFAYIVDAGDGKETDPFPELVVQIGFISHGADAEVL